MPLNGDCAGSEGVVKGRKDSMEEAVRGRLAPVRTPEQRRDEKGPIRPEWLPCSAAPPYRPNRYERHQDFPQTLRPSSFQEVYQVSSVRLRFPSHPSHHLTHPPVWIFSICRFQLLCSPMPSILSGFSSYRAVELC